MSPVAKLCLSIAVLACTSCGAKLGQIGAASDDYADYRAFRVAPTLAGRLRAAAFYLQCHSEGSFRDEVADWFERVEPLYFEAMGGTISGMQTYLEALPNGPHAESAMQLRDALVAAARAEAGERLAEKGAEMERRLAAAAQSREDVVTAYAAWVGRLLDFGAWGRTPDKAGEGFAGVWNADPAPKCDKKSCKKLLSLEYELEVGGKPEAYALVMEVSLALTKGKVTGASISGPDLFSRLGEAHDAEPAIGDEGRSRAVKFVIQLTSGAAERLLPRERCGHDPSEPAVMVRECDGYKLELVPKATTAEEDRVVIRGPRKL